MPWVVGRDVLIIGSVIILVADMLYRGNRYSLHSEPI